MGTEGPRTETAVSVVAVRVIAALVVWLTLWRVAYPLGVHSYLILAILLLSNAALVVVSKGKPTHAVTRYFLIADAILLPVAAIGLNPLSFEIQIVFIVAILVAAGSAWRPAPLLSFGVAVLVNTTFALGGHPDYHVGSGSYNFWLLVLFCIAALGAYFSARFFKQERQIDAAKEEAQKRQALITGVTKTVSYWMNIYETAVRGIPSGIVL